jgi:F0F1-type ATP synthase assembly protein I
MYHRKQQRIMRWTLAVALCSGTVLGVVIWWLSRPRPL